MHLILRNILARNDRTRYDWTFLKTPEGLDIIWQEPSGLEAARVHFSIAELDRLWDMFASDALSWTYEFIEGQEGFATIRNEQGVKVKHVHRYPEEDGDDNAFDDFGGCTS